MHRTLAAPPGRRYSSAMPGNYFPATARLKASYSYRDGSNCPTVFVGGVTVSDTKDRPNPPDPICGMDLRKTSLGNGHIMALQLGGPDVSENIVPQYQQWQQSGRWRTLEKDAMAHCAAGNWIFVAHLLYGNTHSSGLNHKQEFSDGNTTVFWDDPRIPTVFNIWLLDAASAKGKQINDDILVPTVDPTARETAAKNLPSVLATVQMFRKNDDQATQMPQEDINYWRKNELANFVAREFAQYHEDRERHTGLAQGLLNEHGIGKPKEREDMTDVLMSPLRETEYEFVEGYGPTMRTILEKKEGWLPSEVMQYGSNVGMLEAVLHVPQLTGMMKRSNDTRTTAHGKATAKQEARRDSFKKDSKPYADLTVVLPRAYNDDRVRDSDDTEKKRLKRFKNGMA